MKKKLQKGFFLCLLFSSVLNLYACSAKSNQTSDLDISKKEEQTQENIGFVNTETLKMRKEPLEDADVITLLKKEQKVSILSEQDKYYQISILVNEEQLNGYVKKEYIDK